MRILFDEVSDDFRIGFGDELVAFALELFLEFEIVFDDAVVNDDDFAAAVAMRVGIFFRGAAVRGPAGVADPVRALDGRFLNDFFEVAELARRPANLKFPSLVTTAMPAES